MLARATAGRAATVDPKAVEAEPSPWPLDPCTPVARASSSSRRERRSTVDAAPSGCRGTALTAALQLGLADRLTELAVAYAKERVQFDRPIGGFQAIKHMLADMLDAHRGRARAAVYSAGAVLDEDAGRQPAPPARPRRQGRRRRRRDRERQGRNAGVRRHGLHVGGRRAPLPEAGVGARDALRERRRATPSSCARSPAIPGSREPKPDAIVMSMTRPQTTVLAALTERLASDPDGPYLEFSNGDGDIVALTAREMDRESNHLAHTLRELGVRARRSRRDAAREPRRAGHQLLRGVEARRGAGADQHRVQGRVPAPPARRLRRRRCSSCRATSRRARSRSSATRPRPR